MPIPQYKMNESQSHKVSSAIQPYTHCLLKHANGREAFVKPSQVATYHVHDSYKVFKPQGNVSFGSTIDFLISDKDFIATGLVLHIKCTESKYVPGPL